MKRFILVILCILMGSLAIGCKANLGEVSDTWKPDNIYISGDNITVILSGDNITIIQDRKEAMK